MPKYQVEVVYSQSYYITVEANDIEDAEDQAMEIAINNDPFECDDFQDNGDDYDVKVIRELN